MKSTTKMNKCQRGEENRSGQMHALNMQMFNTPINVQVFYITKSTHVSLECKQLFPLMGRPWGKLDFVEI